MSRNEYIQQVIGNTEAVKAFGINYFGKSYDEDCLQETVYIALKKYYSYDGTCSVRTWMIRILINLHKQTFKRLSRLDRDAEIPEQQVTQVIGYDYNYLQGIISKMYYRHRQIITMLEEGWKVGDIAVKRNNSPKYIKSEKIRIKRELAASLSNSGLIENN